MFRELFKGDILGIVYVVGAIILAASIQKLFVHFGISSKPTPGNTGRVRLTPQIWFALFVYLFAVVTVIAVTENWPVVIFRLQGLAKIALFLAATGVSIYSWRAYNEKTWFWLGNSFLSFLFYLFCYVDSSSERTIVTSISISTCFLITQSWLLVVMKKAPPQRY